MKRQKLIQHLMQNECYLLREGGNHSVFHNPNNGKSAAVPRHSEIADLLARKICKQLDIPSVK